MQPMILKILLCLCVLLLSCSALMQRPTAFVSFPGATVTPPGIREPSRTSPRTKTALEDAIAKEIKQAQDTTEKFGKDSQEARVAWSFVEELQSSAAHAKQMKEETDRIKPGSAFMKTYPEKVAKLDKDKTVIGMRDNQALREENESLKSEIQALKDELWRKESQLRDF